jgi:hypothetical protein
VRDLDFPFLRRKEKAFVGKKRRSFKNSIGKHESSDTAVANNQRVKNKTINIFPSTLLKKRKLSPSYIWDTERPCDWWFDFSNWLEMSVCQE